MRYRTSCVDQLPEETRDEIDVTLLRVLFIIAVDEGESNPVIRCFSVEVIDNNRPIITIKSADYHPQGRLTQGRSCLHQLESIRLVEKIGMIRHTHSIAPQQLFLPSYPFAEQWRVYDPITRSFDSSTGDILMFSPKVQWRHPSKDFAVNLVHRCLCRVLSQ